LGDAVVRASYKWLGLVIFFIGCLATPAMAELDLNMREGVTSISNEVYGLHMTIFWVCVGIGIVVFGAMIWSMVYHRKSKGAVASQFHESTTMEILWTVVPIVILVSMAIPATKTLLAMEDTSNSDMTIKVTGLQWKWQYEYVDGDAEGIKFVSSLHPDHNEARAVGVGMNEETLREKFGKTYLMDVDNPLVVPTGKKIRFLITAADVIHAWWVPDLGWKKDAIPGFVNEGWTVIDKPGVYRGKCAELCGRDHGFMPVVVVAKDPADYKEWVTAQRGEALKIAASADRIWNKDELMAKGEQVYNANCGACHMPNGAGMPPVFPAIAGSAVALGDPAGHIDIGLNGRAGTAMAAYRDVLNDVDLAAVITYQRNAWGNNASIVQPADIKSAR
tara:strand:+ start:37296 stop:38465 length:1170 start_codon:yes stop_codon:yes gene_type:complete